MQVQDGNTALMARHYANYIAANNISHTELQRESQLQRFVCVAMAQYKPTGFSDPSGVFNVHAALELWVPGYHGPDNSESSEDSSGEQETKV